MKLPSSFRYLTSVQTRFSLCSTHNRHAAAPAAVIAAQPAPAPARAPAKPSSAELKACMLSHKTSMASFRTWKKQFRAYYDTGHLSYLPCTQQQAYLNSCVDDTLCAKVDREATGTTPINSPIQGLMTCMTIQDNTFLEITCSQALNLKELLLPDLVLWTAGVKLPY